MERLPVGAWRRGAFEKDVAEGHAQPETHDPTGMGIDEIAARIEADRRGIEANARRREKLDDDDELRRERIAANMALLREAFAAEQRFHDQGVIDERFLPTGEAQAKEMASKAHKAELDERKAEIEAEHGVAISKATRRGDKNVFTITEKAKSPGLEHYLAQMRDLIVALARKASILAAMLPRPRVRLVTRRHDLFILAQSVAATPFLLLAAPMRQIE